MKKLSKPKSLPQAFVARKAQILSKLAIPTDTYTDKSPKGSVDSQIVDLIQQINDSDGYVTTSSCAGRVSVFAEGRKSGGESEVAENGGTGDRAAGPGGKGFGGRWLFVSHDPVESRTCETWTEMLALNTVSSSGVPAPLNIPVKSKDPASLRLIRLSYSPLILHVLCASLQHAKPLLAAAINAGFRESGVQSLKILDDPEAGVMLAVRTAGLAFETVVGCVEDGEDGDESKQCWVSEEYLDMCMGVVNERFKWNGRRKNRLEDELRRLAARGEREDVDERRHRKRQEGLRARANKPNQVQQHSEADILENGLTFELG